MRRVLTRSACRWSPTVVAHTADEAAALAARFGFPVVAKLASRQLLHKTEIGAVRLELSSDSAVRRRSTTHRRSPRRTAGSLAPQATAS